MVALCLWLALATCQAQELLPAPPAFPSPVSAGFADDELLRDGGREDAVLCYNQGSTFFVKEPHPGNGPVSPVFQRVTPGASGHMEAFQLRLYNNYPGNQRHNGLVRLSVHRRLGTLPGPFEQEVVFSADSVSSGVLSVPLPFAFPFSAGEEFYLGLTFQPAAAQDTIAYVTAGLGTYTGHSFFMENGQSAWWGGADGTLFGDLHFCAEVWLDNQQAFLQFPWTRVDLGRHPVGAQARARLPILNQGTAALVVSTGIEGDGWSCSLEGPHPLLPPDTLFLALDWDVPAQEASGEGWLFLATNATNNPQRVLPLKASSSVADLLVADWDEIGWGVEQLLDSSDTAHSWRPVTGLGRPGWFMGHEAPLQGMTCLDVLHVGALRLQEDATVRMRWAQYRRHSSGTRRHAFCWRRTGDADWTILDEPDLADDPWLGPADEWWTTPWLEWVVPAAGDYELGLLYGGAGAYDRWYVDDLEFEIQDALAAPRTRIVSAGGALSLEWDAVLGARGYEVRRVDGDGRTRTVAWTTGTSWPLGREQRRGQGWYQVLASDRTGLAVTAQEEP